MTPKKAGVTPQYKHKGIQKVYELYQEHKKEMGKGVNMMSLMWRALAPNIPEYLHMIDEDEELLGKIKTLLGSVMEAMKEDGTGD